jgi:ABC-type antimicrobial peptide transport system permease subunit
MNTEDSDLKLRSSAKVIYRFLGGAALGAFVVIIPISYGSSIDLNLIQISIALLLMVSCGLLSSVWGEKFIDTVMRVLNFSGL